MSLKIYQQNLRSILQNKLGIDTVCEWSARIGQNAYSPRLDIAVGPFSINNDVQLIEEYNKLFGINVGFIKKLVNIHLRNLAYITDDTSDELVENLICQKLTELYHFNSNSRCFMAIEIENVVSRKHLMGGAINASVLGRVGVAVGYNEKKHLAFLNLYRYFSFLENVNKPTFRTDNLLIVSASQLLSVLNEE